MKNLLAYQSFVAGVIGALASSVGKATFLMTQSRTGDAQVWRLQVKKRSLSPLSNRRLGVHL